MTPLMELVTIDPGLCGLVLTAANKVEHDDMTSIEDPKAAATLLGEIRLNKLAKTLPLIPERHMNVPPLNWSNYWMYLVGVAEVSQFICNYLEFGYLSSGAYTAGMLHDAGKLALLKLHPFGFQAITRYAAEKKISSREAERRHLGCTTRDLGVILAEHMGLPAVYSRVMRWIDHPDQATEHVDLVAMVSLARHVCLMNRVGQSGDPHPDGLGPISGTMAWQVLQPRLFPSFDLKKFEAQAHAYCLNLRQDLSGKVNRKLVLERAVA
jgi:HD-like signal output (HDOD) protein